MDKLLLLSLFFTTVSAWGKKKAPEPEYSNTLELFMGGWGAAVSVLCAALAVKNMGSKPAAVEEKKA